MCGIAGFSTLNERTRALFPWLAYEIEKRGDDSWGVSNGEFTVRNTGSALGSAYIPKEFKDGDVVGLHTRAMSVGKICIENTHPFTIKGSCKHVIGMHNGCISNHTELKKQYNWDHEVDSPIVFKVIAEGGDTKQISGWGALMWWERYVGEKGEILYDTTQVKFCKFNMSDLHIFRLDSGEIVWASTSDAIERPCKHLGLKIATEYVVDGDTEYSLGVDDSGKDELYKEGPMRFGGRAYAYSGRSSYGYFPNRENTTNSPGSIVKIKDTNWIAGRGWVQGWRINGTWYEDNEENQEVIHGVKSPPPTQLALVPQPPKPLTDTPGYGWVRRGDAWEWTIVQTTPTATSKADKPLKETTVYEPLSNIGKASRDGGWCLQCYKVYVNRWETVMCAKCKKDTDDDVMHVVGKESYRIYTPDPEVTI